PPAPSPGAPASRQGVEARSPGEAPTAGGAARTSFADGVTAIEASSSVQLAHGDATLTAPAGARFEVEVRASRIVRVAVKAGWVVMAGSHTATAMITSEQT